MTEILVYFPAVVLALGWIEFVLTCAWGPAQHTIGLSAVLAVCLFIRSLFLRRKAIQSGLAAWFKDLKGCPLPFYLLLCTAIGILGISGWEAAFPPHLSRDYDAINYHMAIPRQHLLQGTLSHLEWSSADLWPMSVQWGLAPLWFTGSLFNKLPQYFFALWTFFLLIRLARRKTGPGYASWIPALAWITTQGVVIQLGSAMIDIPLLFLTLATWDAIQKKSFHWAALCFSFLFTSKAFAPPQWILILAFMAIYEWAAHGNRLLKSRPASALKASLLGLTLIAVLLSRSALVSFARAGTPLFPFGVCLSEKVGIHVAGCQGVQGQWIKRSAQEQIQTRDDYGEGRSLRAFLAHFWKVSVPNAGVNNAYDYPLGLSWLLLVIFLAIEAIPGFRKEKLSTESAIALSFWIVWWLGSQQSRWLYPVLAFGWLGTLPIQRTVRSHALLSCLAIGSLFSLISQYRAIFPEALQTHLEVQRKQTAALQFDPASGLIRSQETLYFDGSIKKHAPGSPYWILR